MPAHPLNAVMVAARRTPVAPRNGGLSSFEAWELAAAAIKAVLADSRLPANAVDEVILGNALGAGGNPARLAALAAGLPDSVPAATVDTQCCAGLDAIALAASRVRAGEARVVICGGMESFSRAPIRARRPKTPAEKPEPYDQPPFTPWPDRDPEMVASAAALAAELGVPRGAQEAYAVESHRKALDRGPAAGEIVTIGGVSRDPFPRRLKPALCERLPVLAGDLATGATAATTAVEADAAAIVLVTSEDVAKQVAARRPLRILGSARRGGDPERPGLAPIAAARAVLEGAEHRAEALVAAEVMEAFAVQAIACIEGVGLHRQTVNRGGGALARGHPIGASGAILAVRLWHDFQRESLHGVGLCAIAAAGGLGTAMLVAS